MTEERDLHMEPIRLECLTRAILELTPDETSIGDINLPGVEQAIPIWETVADLLLCDSEAVERHNFFVLRITRDTQRLRDVVAFLKSGGIRLPVPVKFGQETTADDVEAVIRHFAADTDIAHPETIPALVGLLRELVADEAGPPEGYAGTDIVEALEAGAADEPEPQGEQPDNGPGNWDVPDHGEQPQPQA